MKPTLKKDKTFSLIHFIVWTTRKKERDVISVLFSTLLSTTCKIQLNRKDWNGMGYISFWSMLIMIIYWT